MNALNTSPSTSAADGRGQQRLNYLRGDPSQEGATVTSFRQRPTSKLGDIVNSSPNYVAAPNAGIGLASYAQFRLNYLNRTPMIYVGGNDGMLHGFRASDGRELLAYVPSKVHTQLNKLTSKTYTHQYFVDGSPQVGDAFIGTAVAHGAGRRARRRRPGNLRARHHRSRPVQRGERRQHGDVGIQRQRRPRFRLRRSARP